MLSALIDPTVPVLVVSGQLFEAVTGGGAKKLTPIIYFPVQVFVDYEESAARTHKRNIFRFRTSADTSGRMA
jgi:hypothetical protein